MAQVSQFWGGATIGDSGPYSFDQYNRPFRVLVSNGSADAGIAVRYLNQLAGTTTGLRANGVDILSGAALVRGIWYTSTATINHALPAVGAGMERTDLIVLRASWSDQTVRQVRLVGTEYILGSPNVPPALTQTDYVTWEIPLFEVNVTTGNDVSLGDRRRFSIMQHFGKALVGKMLFGRSG